MNSILRHTLFVFLSLVFLSKTKAQSLQILSSETKEGIEGVSVYGVTSQKKIIFQKISDALGNVFFTSGKIPSEIILQHLNYDDKSIQTKDLKDTNIFLKPKNEQLEEVVITGNFEAQSARNYVYQVKSIDLETIEKLAALDLETVLRQQLNIRFQNDPATGTSNLSMMGMSGKYTKVLLDGMPIGGKSGTAFEIDLNSLDLSTIKRIEIVEGPMASIYGADALAGVINLISKKSTKGKKIEASLSLQEETVGNSPYAIKTNNYSPNETFYNGNHHKKNGGLHQHKLNLSSHLSENVFIGLNLNQRSFDGFKENLENRDFTWKPKRNRNVGAVLNYGDEKLTAFIRADFGKQKIYDYENFNPAGVANDVYFISNRHLYTTQLNYKAKENLNLNFASSYTDFERVVKKFQTIEETGKKENSSEEDNIDKFLDFHNRLVLNHSPTKPSGIFNLSYLLGIEYNQEKGEGSRIQGSPQMVNKALFSSVEFKFWKERLKIRPAIRYAHNSTFGGAFVPQVNLKYSFTENINLRIAYGRGYKAPNLRELYFEFIDTNHNIVGNEDLNPEYSNHVSANLDYNKKLNPNSVLNSKLSFFHNSIENKITSQTSLENPQQSTYYNLDHEKTLGLNLNQGYKYKSLKLNAGISFTGIELKERDELTDIHELKTYPELNVNLTYKIPKIKVLINAFYKYTGKLPAIMENDKSEKIIAHFPAYDQLDFNLSKTIFESLKIGLGIRNLFDLKTTNLPQGTSSGDPHASNSSRQISYGRSFFINLNYAFSKK